MTPKRKTEDGREVRYLTQEQVTRFFSAIPAEAVRDRLLFSFMYRFGLRATEAAELPTAAVDRENWAVTVQGLKNGLRRSYTIPRDLRRPMRTWKPTGEWFFAGRQGALSRVRVWQLFKQYAKAAGLPDYGVHSLRHSAAVHALDADLTTEEVRDLLRHRRLSSTDVYASISDVRRRRYLDRLEKSSAVVKLK
jgi:integrase/recombinase XerD